jgi:hypothetical protein
MAKPKVVTKPTRKVPAKVLKNAKPAKSAAKPARAQKPISDNDPDAEVKRKRRLYYLNNREALLIKQKERYAANPDAVIARVNGWREETDNGKKPLYKQKNNKRGRAPQHIVLPRLHENAPVPRTTKPAKKNGKKPAVKVVAKPTRKVKVETKPTRKVVAKPTRKVVQAAKKPARRSPMR